MDISIPPAQQSIVDGLVSAGRFASPDEAVAEGIRLLASQESLRGQVQVGIDQANRSDLTPHAEVFQELRDKIASRGEDSPA